VLLPRIIGRIVLKSLTMLNRQQSARSTNLAFPWLDLLRSIACLFVVTGHIRNLFFEDFQNVTDQTLLNRCVYLVTGFASESVIVFFVLSGLLVGGKVVRDIDRNEWSWNRYLIERFSRLLIVLWPALLLTFCFDTIGRYFFGTAGIYGGNRFGANSLPEHMEVVSSAGVYLANAFFLQGILTPTAGTNTPLWSLSNEFWYYIAFPALYICLSKSIRTVSKKWALVILIVAGIMIGAGQMFEGFIIWLMGVATVFLSRKSSFRFSGAAFFGLATLLGSLTLARFNKAGAFADQLIGISTAILCFGIITSSKGGRPIGTKLFQFMSSFSYTLYLTHLPLVVFIRASLGDTSRWQPTIQYLSLGVLLSVIAIVWAYLVYRLTEIHTPTLRKILLNTKRADALS
jgi:peptidoglycan/LPS O-acetylase OafA/YrhL